MDCGTRFHVLDPIRDGSWHTTSPLPPANGWCSSSLTNFAPFLYSLRGLVKTTNTPDWLWLLVRCCLAPGLMRHVLCCCPTRGQLVFPARSCSSASPAGRHQWHADDRTADFAIAQPREFIRQWPRWHRELPVLLLQCVLALLLRNVQGGFRSAAGLLLPPAAWLRPAAVGAGRRAD